MKQKAQQAVVITLTLVFVGLLVWGSLWAALAFWRRFSALNPELAVGLITGVSATLVAVLTITLGRYFERKKEVEAHFRDKKSLIYDEFLKEFFKIYHNESGETVDLVPFLREWQSKVILWGGVKVLTTYLKWGAHLKKGTPDAQSMFLMEDFFLALRRDLGLSNRGLERGAFVRLILKHADLFLALARENPNVTLEEVGKREKELGLEA